MSEFYFQTYKRRISSLHRDIACEGVAYLPQENGAGRAAALGTAMHKRLEEGKLPQITAMAYPGGYHKDFHEISMGLTFHEGLTYVTLEPGLVHHLTPGPGVMTGHADIIPLTAVFDYKTGKSIESYVWTQLAAYAALANADVDYKVTQLGVIHHPPPAARKNETDEELFDRWALKPAKLVMYQGDTATLISDTYKAMGEVVSRTYNPIHDFTPGDHCKFCPGRFSCPEYPGHVRGLEDNFFALKELRERGL